MIFVSWYIFLLYTSATEIGPPTVSRASRALLVDSTVCSRRHWKSSTAFWALATSRLSECCESNTWLLTFRSLFLSHTLRAYVDLHACLFIPSLGRDGDRDRQRCLHDACTKGDLRMSFWRRSEQWAWASCMTARESGLHGRAMWAPLPSDVESWLSLRPNTSHPHLPVKTDCTCSFTLLGNLRLSTLLFLVCGGGCQQSLWTDTARLRRLRGREHNQLKRGWETRRAT